MPTADRAQTRPAVLALIREAWVRGLFPVYLWGPTGTGKSCAASVVATGWWEKECESAAKENRSPRPPLWWSWQNLCEVLCRCRQNGYALMPRPDGGDYELYESSLWNVLGTNRLLVVDEIGTRVANEVRLEAMLRLLETRRGLPTILTGNIGRDGIGGKNGVFDDRVLSRMTAGMWIQFDGVDRRAEGFGKRSVKAE